MDHTTENKYTTTHKIGSIEELFEKHHISSVADSSRKKVDEIIGKEEFEKRLHEQEEARKKARAALRRKRGENESESENESENIIYEAKAAVIRGSKARRRKEGVIHRCFRLRRELRAADKRLKRDRFFTREKKKTLYLEAFKSAWGPLVDSLIEAEATLWSFIREVGKDAWAIVLFLADMVVFAGYYISKAALFLWDRLWDLRYALDKNKERIFLWFSSTIGVLAVTLIVVSSLSAYEYSYYGKKLGIAKSKQDVYNTIEILGDKISIATGANVNIDVERDIEFKKLYGFKIDVDTTDDILNTLTYMKDLQTDAYAVCINSEQAVIVEDEETAKNLIASVRNDFTGDRQVIEYKYITFAEDVTIEPVQVLLGDVWNPDDAIRYIETGSTEEINKDDPAAVIKPLVTVLSYETASYDVQVEYGIDYVENSSMYTDETSMISEGVYGQDIIVANIERVNGVEISKEIVSTTRVSNPINATYYQGTKPIPARTGTGTWIWPLKVSAPNTTRFHERYGIVGVSSIHQGVDYGCPTGTKIYAADGGTVSFAGYKSGYGYVVEIDHGGLYKSLYGHCSKLLVKAGDKVYQGQNIAISGSTGVSTGSHLHYEVRYKDVAINPESLYPKGHI